MIFFWQWVQIKKTSLAGSATLGDTSWARLTAKLTSWDALESNSKSSWQPNFGWWGTLLEMLGNHPGYGWWPSLRKWVTIFSMVRNHPWDGSCHLVLVLWVKSNCQILSLLTLPIGGWPSLGCWVTILGMVGDHPCQLLPGLSFVS